MIEQSDTLSTQTTDKTTDFPGEKGEQIDR